MGMTKEQFARMCFGPAPVIGTIVRRNRVVEVTQADAKQARLGVYWLAGKQSPTGEVWDGAP